MKTLLCIDGNSILNRAFYGIRPLTASDGLPTQAVYGMINILLHHMESLSPDHMLCAFDRREPTFRHLRYEGYKATRHGMPEELAVQLPYAKQAVEYLGIPLCSLAGYEADDILGTCAAFADADPDLTVYLLTGDRDSFQLIRDRVHVLYAATGNTTDMTRAVFSEKYPGITPEGFVDLKALMGDSSDNIPGVPGIGEKTALKLMAQFGSLDALYADFESSDLTPSVKKKLAEGRESAYLSRELAQICTSAPIGLTLSDLHYGGIRRQEMAALLRRLELSRLLTRLGLDRAEKPSDPSETAAAPSAPTEPTVCAPSELTNGLSGMIGLHMSTDSDAEAVTLTVSDGKLLRTAQGCGKDALAALFSEGSFAVFDAKTLYKQLSAIGVSCTAEITDITLAAYMLNPSAAKYEPERLCQIYLSASLTCTNPAYLAACLAPPILSGLEETGQLALYREVELPLTRVLASMEMIGFRIDRTGMEQFAARLDTMCESRRDEVYEAAGCSFNLNSPKQLSAVLFDTLGLPPLKKTASGYSTDAETLEKLRPYHPIVSAILEYRQVAKLKSTYADGLLKVADENGRIHSIFHQTVTATGRLSSSEPNLQNIPIKTELGREFRRYFIPESDEYLLIDADYSQIELRLLACIAGDEAMIHAFCSGADIHTDTASRVFGIPPEAVTPEIRKRAKAVNFGIIYGIGAYSLSQDLGITRKQAQAYIDQYLDQYPAVREYMARTVADAKRDGYTATIFGRRRPIPELASKRKPEQAFGERIAMNSPIQGAAADIIKIAMINVSARLRAADLDARLILQVHDELILEAHRSCAEQAAAILRESMEHAVSLPVPLTVDIGMGANWLAC